MEIEKFRFRQFDLFQNDLVFRVGTDGVLLAAWTDTSGVSSVLDVGTGTGLIALIMAQRNHTATIDAIDIQEEACRLSSMSFTGSPWSGRLNVSCRSFQDYSAASARAFDLIITNPPFFSGSLRSPKALKNLARHDDTLSMREILEGAGRLLSPEGRLAIIYPCPQAEKFTEMAHKGGLHCIRKLHVRPLPGKGFIRTMMEFGFSPVDCQENEITIESGERHHYTEEFKELTGGYYLYFLH